MKKWKRVDHRPFGLVVTEVDEHGNYSQTIQWAAESLTTVSESIWEWGWKNVDEFIRTQSGFKEVEE